MQIVTLDTPSGPARSLEQVASLLGLKAGELPIGARYAVGRYGDLDTAWERHGEFETVTFIYGGAREHWFDISPFQEVIALASEAPGQIIRASKIRLLAPDEAPDEAALGKSFSLDDLTVSDLADRRARIWTDFRLHPDGYGRLLLADHGASGRELGELLQSVQDIGNYRKLALLGLPIARGAAPKLGQLEGALASLTEHIASGLTEDDEVLAELTTMSAELARITAGSRFRMSATRAYTHLCMERIRRLRVGAVAGYRSLEDFTERRLLPAARTCEAFSERLDDLARRTSAVSELLRTRIDTKLSKQNRDLLASMDRRTDLQLSLQQMVERLSVVAISYYVVGLLSYIIKPLHLSVPTEIVLGIAAPVSMILLAIIMATLKRDHGNKAP